MNKKILAGTGLAFAAALALTACGGTTAKNTPSAEAVASDAPVTAPTASPIPSSTPKPKDTNKSVRGNLIAKPGDVGTLTDQRTNKVTTKFTVDSFAEAQCTERFAKPSENGHLILVNMTVETTPELVDSSNPRFDISSYQFKYISDNGTTFNGSLGTISTYSCIADSLEFPMQGMGPGEKVSGAVVLDIPTGPGVLVYTGGTYSGPGFEYKIS